MRWCIYILVARWSLARYPSTCFSLSLLLLFLFLPILPSIDLSIHFTDPIPLTLQRTERGSGALTNDGIQKGKVQIETYRF